MEETQEPNFPVRPRYRAGKKDTLVKAFTINQESRYLMVKNVPLGNITELIKLFALYGTIEEYRLLDEEEAPEFTDVYWIKYASITSARIAKRKCDDFYFQGNMIEVTYATQYESVYDMKAKLDERRRIVLFKINQHNGTIKKRHEEVRKHQQNDEDISSHLQNIIPIEHLPYDAPPQYSPSAIELLPSPVYKNEKVHLYTSSSQHNPPRHHPFSSSSSASSSASSNNQPAGTNKRKEMTTTTSSGEPNNNNYYGDTSVGATVLSIRSKLHKVSFLFKLTIIDHRHPSMVA
eukprot:TRINITY_DN5516_c0_g1_i1.p1 TRINITY_DN5516_c0_g1~~TRINITY_DN5516_c0_g1_i1.p1  ORF type:complete len:291 (+),score=90.45 TRINITY_DN5516_c0_g1_i1:14-886(+)